MFPKSLIALIIAAILLPLPTPVSAADCSQKTCIDVYTRDGELVIEAKKGASQKSTVRKVPKKVAVAVPKVIKPKIAAPPKTTVKKVVPKKLAVKKSVTKKVLSLADRLTKKLPTTEIIYQPQFQPLTDIPIYFWCDLPAIFHTKETILGEVVDIAMRPSFTWSFGDGTFHTSTDPGAPFPDGKIRHGYKKAGTYEVTLLTTWNGTFENNGATRAITGEIKKISITAVKVVAAPTRFMN